MSHYHGKLEHERKYERHEKSELWEVQFQPDSRTKPVAITPPPKEFQKEVKAVSLIEKIMLFANDENTFLPKTF